MKLRALISSDEFLSFIVFHSLRTPLNSCGNPLKLWPEIVNFHQADPRAAVEPSEQRGV
jgi:hypothetical protein